MLLVGAGLGVAIAGVPSRTKDPPLRIQTESTIAPVPAETTTTTAATVAPTVLPAPPRTTARPTTTARRR